MPFRPFLLSWAKVFRQLSSCVAVNMKQADSQQVFTVWPFFLKLEWALYYWNFILRSDRQKSINEHAMATCLYHSVKEIISVNGHFTARDQQLQDYAQRSFSLQHELMLLFHPSLDLFVGLLWALLSLGCSSFMLFWSVTVLHLQLNAPCWLLRLSKLHGILDPSLLLSPLRMVFDPSTWTYQGRKQPSVEKRLSLVS